MIPCPTLACDRSTLESLRGFQPSKEFTCGSPFEKEEPKEPPTGFVFSSSEFARAKHAQDGRLVHAVRID